jgi:hypothetical protein
MFLSSTDKYFDMTGVPRVVFSDYPCCSEIGSVCLDHIIIITYFGLIHINL